VQLADIPLLLSQVRPVVKGDGGLMGSIKSPLVSQNQEVFNKNNQKASPLDAILKLEMHIDSRYVIAIPGLMF